MTRATLSFLAALAFLTRVPVPRSIDRSMARVAAAQAWFPVVGLLIGLMLLGIDEAASRALPHASVDVLLVVALVIITGGLHLDGLSDAADGVFGGRTREQRLHIMRDVHIGAFGVIAIVCVLAMKWAGFESLPGDVRAEAIVLAPCVARFAVLLPAVFIEPARAEGLGAALREHPPFAVVTAGAVALIASVALLGFGGAAAVVCAAGCAAGIGLIARAMVGGMTGDLYGASIEVAEAVTLLFIGALANRNWIEAWLFG
jgi:adenosylcobinamide-GDP ribazoletransferase